MNIHNKIIGCDRRFLKKVSISIENIKLKLKNYKKKNQKILVHSTYI